MVGGPDGVSPFSSADKLEELKKPNVSIKLYIDTRKRPVHDFHHIRRWQLAIYNKVEPGSNNLVQ